MLAAEDDQNITLYKTLLLCYIMGMESIQSRSIRISKIPASLRKGIVVIGAFVILLTLATTMNLASAQNQQQQTFTAKLSGNDEVPPVSTTATGMSQFKVSPDANKISYILNATNLNNFMMAHIHQGKAGENGEPVAALSMGNGTITSSDLKGPLAGKQISDLVNLMNNGQAYVNIHTQQNMNGEIRGQVMPG
jgi:CHRD domain